MTPDVIVIGAGAIGTSIAYHLVKSGARVVIVERGHVGGEASGASAGMIIGRPDRATPEALARLSTESARLYPPLAEELRDRTAIDIGYRRTGLLEIAFDELAAHELRSQRAWQSGRGLSAGWLDREAALQLEPALNPAVKAALHYADESQVLPSMLALAMARAAVDLGASLRECAGVDRLLTEGDRVIGVRLGDETIYAGEVVAANGAWASAWSELLRRPIPVRPVRGQMVALRTTATALRQMVMGRDGYVLSKPDGSTYVGTTVEDAGFDTRPTADGVATLLALVPRLVPRLGEASFVRAWAGLRPGTPDGLPLIGRLTGWDGITLATGHFRNGILLAPITGELVADLLVRRQPRLPLDAFDPGRFLVRAA